MWVSCHMGSGFAAMHVCVYEGDIFLCSVWRWVAWWPWCSVAMTRYVQWKLLSSVHTVFKSGLTKLSRVFSTTNICIIMQQAKNKMTTTKIPNKTKTQEKDQCALKKGDNCGKQHFFFLTTDAFGLKRRNPVLAVEGWVPTQIQKNRATAGNESSDTLCHCCSLFFDNKCFWTVTQTKWLTA